jgi:UTP:GlnB (protein PII) uridylyltransferase
LSNLKIDNEDQITNRYQEITKALNQEFRNTESKTDNCLQVGSYGRWTAIKGISDLDMLYILPCFKMEGYEDGGQSELLKKIRKMQF